MSQTFEDVIWPLRHGLFRYGLTILGNTTEAEDLVQDVMLKLFKMMQNSDIVLKPKSLAFTMLRNACFDLKRKASTRYESNGVDASEIMHAYRDDSFDRKETMSEIMRAVQTLSIDQKEVFVLREIEGYSYEEIEEMTGISNKNLRVRISRARKILRKELSSFISHE